MTIGLPADYVADQDVRLRLYRRIADVNTLPDIDALSEEFADRFGPLPDEVRYLVYQMKVKLLAEKGGLASVSVENGQLVLRFPPLPEGMNARPLPDLGPEVRRGKNALWLHYSDQLDWPDQLLAVLDRLVST
jgi:transcription-repair coupling factor (superfamily II helicase)